MKKIFIKNRKGQKLAVIIEKPKNPKGLAFVMHGYGGFKEQGHIETVVRSFYDNYFTVIRFDAAGTVGESDGVFEEATSTSYYQDLEDVIMWSKTQSWYKEPFALAAHSLGGLCISKYAQDHEGEVSLLAPLGSNISGKLILESDHFKEYEEKWKSTGWKVKESTSKPGVIKRTPWSFIEDVMQYDLLLEAHKLTIPVLLVVGSKDNGTPLEHQQLLFDKLPGPKEIHVIEGSGHTFREQEHLEQLRNIFDKWLEKYAK